jgi:predicted aminopeptidase
MRAKRSFTRVGLPGAIPLLAIVALGTSGCYLSHLAVGQARLLRARQPIEAMLADPTTPPKLRERLATVPRVRAFASDLGLDVGERYTSYVSWPGDRIVTSVVATRPGEVHPAGWYFPIVGRVPYKGFFSRERARAEADRQRAKGHDVCEFAVSAYSTLGWFDDPITGPMLRGDEGTTVETILHELVHATVYVRSDAEFNEGVASFIGEEASVRFYAESDRPEAARRERARIEDDRRLRSELLRLRQGVKDLYASSSPGNARDLERADLENRAREAIGALALPIRDVGEIAGRLRLNDACLALAGTYNADVDGYARALAALAGDLRIFVARVRESATAADPRAALLSP